MTEKQHTSGDIICYTFNDVNVFYDILAVIGNITICSSISQPNAIVYIVASNSLEAIETFNVAWNDYKGAI